MKWGFSDQSVQFATNATQKADAAHTLDDIGTLYPQMWRVNCPWGRIFLARDPGTVSTDPESGLPIYSNRNWSWCDWAVNEFLRRGYEIVMVVGQERPNSWGYGPVGPTDYAQCVTEAATRYRPGGNGIRTDGIYAGNSGRGVSIYECWNEPNSQMWQASISERDYTDYLVAGYNALKAVPGLSGSNSKWLFGGLQHLQETGPYLFRGAVSEVEYTFVEKCYDYAELDDPGTGKSPFVLHDFFDAMNVHVYPQTDTTAPDAAGSQQSSPQPSPGGGLFGFLFAIPLTLFGILAALFGVGGSTSGAVAGTVPGPAPDVDNDNFRQMRQIRDLIIAKGDSDPRFFITELGYGNFGMTEALQAEYLPAAFEICASYPWVDAILIYSTRDSAPGMTPGRDDQYGMLRADWSRKPVWTWLTSLLGGGVASGSYGWSSNAAGIAGSNGHGTAAGSYGWAHTAFGVRGHGAGAASGTYSWSGIGAGVAGSGRGTAAGNYGWSSHAEGVTAPPAILLKRHLITNQAITRAATV